MSEPMLEVSGLNAWYGAAHILFDLSFRIEPGEVVALMGRNGAGKSTTIKALMALIARRSGTVCFCGEDISTFRPFEIARRGLGFVPEDRRIFSDLTVLENLDIGRQPPRHFPDGRPAPSWTASCTTCASTSAAAAAKVHVAPVATVAPSSCQRAIASFQRAEATSSSKRATSSETASALKRTDVPSVSNAAPTTARRSDRA